MQAETVYNQCALIKPGSNLLVFFQLVEEAFHQMSLLVQITVTVEHLLVLCAGSILGIVAPYCSGSFYIA